MIEREGGGEEIERECLRERERDRERERERRRERESVGGSHIISHYHNCISACRSKNLWPPTQLMRW